jgi:hypothetical protein
LNGPFSHNEAALRKKLPLRKSDRHKEHLDWAIRELNDKAAEKKNGGIFYP